MSDIKVSSLPVVTTPALTDYLVGNYGTTPQTATVTVGSLLNLLSMSTSATWTTPGTIGSVTPNTGAFTTLTAGNTSVGALLAYNISVSNSAVPAAGLYLPAANTLGWSTDSTQRMKLDSTGLTVIAGGLVIPKTTNVGIKVDTAAPTFGWRDMLGAIEVRGVGANDPNFAVFGATALRGYQFSATVMNEVFIVYHVPHDYVPGTDVHIHAHWSNAQATPNTGNVVWGFEYTYAKGFNQAAFPATTTVTVTQACPATRYQHNIAETSAITISGLEVDGLILVRAYRDATNVADTCTDAVFFHTADIHYQSTNMATKGKAPDFYT